MKFNLKNRPKPPKFHNWRNIHEFIYEYNEWFEGFEKELREKLKHYEFEGQNWELQEILKEILGE